MLSRMRRALLCAAVALGLLVGARPALAFDPMLMFLFGMLCLYPFVQ